MEDNYNKLKKSIDHILALHSLFSDRDNYNFPNQKVDYELYNENYVKLTTSFVQIEFSNQLYDQRNRQMILADIIEYILIGRGFYSMGSTRGTNPKKFIFIKCVLYFVNLLMCYEAITVDYEKRRRYLQVLSEFVPEISEEELYNELLDFQGNIGIPGTKASIDLNRYFDKLLPKTAGGLWHELLVYIFLLRNNFGYILPLLLHQKIYSLTDHLVPPDFLIITYDKRIYGIEVGIKKEIQSGSFSLKTAIPTATIDTINSRNSDRCPYCQKWIGLCPFVIENYSNSEYEINKIKVNCFHDCNIFTRQQITAGECKYSKYSRNRAKTILHSHHPFSDGKHYHYQCVLRGVDKKMRSIIINAEDTTAIKTHFPYYSGLEELM